MSTGISHDLLKKYLMPNISERQELIFARLAAALAVSVAGCLEFTRLDLWLRW